jgi:hypothetical protein
MAEALRSLATAGLFTAKWTVRIESEWIAALEAKRPDLKGRLELRRDQMREAIPDWEVSEQAWRACAGGLDLKGKLEGRRDVPLTPDLAHLLAGLSKLCEWLDTRGGISAQMQGHALQGVQEQNYIRRPLDLLRVHHEKIEAWTLEQAGIRFDAKAASAAAGAGALRVVAG